MADELNENAEFGRKHKNEEEPILVAQRFLNIFRQMHIFNKQRRQQFDAMLLDMPSDIRILLSTLPGGSLLIEHIEELEKKNGLVPIAVKSKTARNAPTQEKDESPKTNKPAAAGTVVIDASFASELSSSLTMALQQTERRYKEDIRTLTETLTSSITESQTAIGNMIKDILITAQKNFKTENEKQPQVIVLPPQYATVPFDAANQTALPETTAPVITKDLIINNTQPKPEAEKKPETEPEKPAVKIKPDKPEASSQPSKPKPEKTQAPKAAENPPAPLPEPEHNETQLAPAKKKKKKNKKNKNKSELSEQNTTPIPESTASAVAAETFDVSDLLAGPEPETAPEGITPAIENELSFADEDFKLDDLSFDEPLDSGKESEAEDFSMKIDPEPISEPTPEPIEEPETASPFENELDKIRLALQDDDENELEATSEFVAQPEKPKDAPETQASEEVAPAPVTLPKPENISPVTEPVEEVPLDSINDTPISLDDLSFDTTYSSQEHSDFDDLTPPDYSPVNLDQISLENEPAEPAPTAPDNNEDSDWVYVEDDGSHSDDQDWEWEYVDTEAAPTSETDDDEWEWEYVEDDGSDEQDWEWEYVEEGNDDTQNKSK